MKWIELWAELQVYGIIIGVALTLIFIAVIGYLWLFQIIKEKLKKKNAKK